MAEQSNPPARRMATQEITTPNPDPTVLTTTALLREITGSRELAQILVNFTRELVERQMKGDREYLNVRIEHLEKAMEQVPANWLSAVNQVTLNVDEKLKVYDQRFDNIKIQFAERDTRSETSRGDATKAIDAAFASADKAINKTETGFKDQITEQGKRIDTVSKSSDEKHTALKELINNEKDRITALESRLQGATVHRSESVSYGSLLVAIAVAAVAIIGAISVVAVMLHR
jgi:hypothetical protein